MLSKPNRFVLMLLVFMIAAAAVAAPVGKVSDPYSASPAIIHDHHVAALQPAVRVQSHAPILQAAAVLLLYLLFAQLAPDAPPAYRRDDGEPISLLLKNRLLRPMKFTSTFVDISLRFATRI